MDLITRADVEELCLDRSGVCLSLYAPLNKTGLDVRQNSIRFKNLLAEAEIALGQAQARPLLIQKMLEPAHELLREDGDRVHLEAPGTGFALFIAPDEFRSFRLTVPVSEEVIADRRFHILPVLPMLVGDGRFYVLAVGQHGVQLFRGTRHTFELVNLPDAPQNVDQVLQIEWNPEVQFHQVSPRTHVGSHPAVYSGSAEDGKKQTELGEFFARIDTAVNKVVHDARDPIVFAGVDYLFPLYRAHASAQNIMPDFIPGTPRLEPPHELHARAWKIVEPDFQKPLAEAVAAFPERLVRHAASQDLAEILQALQVGRVQTLFLARGHRQWGTFDPITGETHLEDERRKENEDLLETAAIQTIRQRGDIFLLNPDEMPGSNPIAALYRFVLEPHAPAVG
jgi:hypothetical protein